MGEELVVACDWMRMISSTVSVALSFIFAQSSDSITEAQEVRNERALGVLKRVQDKLSGRDFNPDDVLSVQAQVDKLIVQATSIENLCQCFSGWYVLYIFLVFLRWLTRFVYLRCAFW